MLSRNLVEDIVELILIQLPAKSLVRFKAVSKTWCQLIESPQFITKHYHKRASVSNNGCLFIKDRRQCRFYLLCNHLPTWNRLRDLNRMGTYAGEIFHCNGLICLLTKGVFDNVGKFNVDIWNPANRQYKTLPSHISSPGIRAYRNFLGLSFDHNCNGYKAVMVWTFYRPRDGGMMHDNVNKVEVWTPGKDTWKEIDMKLEVWTPQDRDKWRRVDTVVEFPLPSISTPINLKGKLYWLSQYLNKHVIVSFDMVSEVFRLVHLPDGQCFLEFPGRMVHLPDGQMFVEGEERVTLAILNESIVVFSIPLEHNKQCYEVWQMIEDSDTVCWSKYMTVELPALGRSMEKVKIGELLLRDDNGSLSPIGIWNNRELILRDEYGRLSPMGFGNNGDLHWNNGELIFRDDYGRMSPMGLWNKGELIIRDDHGRPSTKAYWNNGELIIRDDYGGRLSPMGFWNNGELILCDDYGRLLFFNMTTGDIVYGGVKIHPSKQAFQLYNESLVSINEWC